MRLSNKAYDTLKWVVQVVLPAIGAFYAGMAVLWSFPHGNEVVGSIALVATLLGSLLGISNIKYNREAEIEEH